VRSRCDFTARCCLFAAGDASAGAGSGMGAAVQSRKCAQPARNLSTTGRVCARQGDPERAAGHFLERDRISAQNKAVSDLPNYIGLSPRGHG